MEGCSLVEGPVRWREAVNGAWILKGWPERASTLRGHRTAELAARPEESSGSFSFPDALDILGADIRSAI